MQGKKVGEGAAGFWPAWTAEPVEDRRVLVKISSGEKDKGGVLEGKVRQPGRNREEREGNRWSPEHQQNFTTSLGGNSQPCAGSRHWRPSGEQGHRRSDKG